MGTEGREKPSISGRGAGKSVAEGREKSVRQGVGSEAKRACCTELRGVSEEPWRQAVGSVEVCLRQEGCLTGEEWEDSSRLVRTPTRVDPRVAGGE